MTRAGTHTAEFWAQVLPVWWKWDPPSLRGVKIGRITQKKPQDPEPGCLLVKLKITVPAAAFITFAEAEITVPEGMFVPVPPVTVEAQPPPQDDQP